MKYLRLRWQDRPRHGSLEGDRVTLLDGDPLRGPVRPSGETLPLAEAHLLPPCQPSKIVGVGLNYRSHAAEMGKQLPAEPLLFLKPPSALLASGQPIVLPRGYARIDYEGELCAVIGRRTRNVGPTDALDCLLGLTLCNDVTVRDLQVKEVQYTRAKGFDSFAPVGPCIATGLDPRALRLRTRLNGELRQDGSTDDMVFSVAELVAFASRVMTLEPGDLLTTGTPPGVGRLAPGDTVEIEVADIGTLSNPVVEASE